MYVVPRVTSPLKFLQSNESEKLPGATCLRNLLEIKFSHYHRKTETSCDQENLPGFVRARVCQTHLTIETLLVHLHQAVECILETATPDQRKEPRNLHPGNPTVAGAHGWRVHPQAGDVHQESYRKVQGSDLLGLEWGSSRCSLWLLPTSKTYTP